MNRRDHRIGGGLGHGLAPQAVTRRCAVIDEDREMQRRFIEAGELERRVFGRPVAIVAVQRCLVTTLNIGNCIHAFGQQPRLGNDIEFAGNELWRCG